MRRRIGGEHAGALLDRLRRVALHTDEELLGVVEHVGHLAATLFGRRPATRAT